MSKTYNKALDLMAVALAATINGKPELAARALTKASKDASAKKALSAIVKANRADTPAVARADASVSRYARTLASRVNAAEGDDPDLDLGLSGEEQRIEVDADAFDEELLEDFEEAVVSASKKRALSKKKAKAEDEDADDGDEEDDADESDDEDEDDEKEEARVARARLQRALSNLTRGR